MGKLPSPPPPSSPKPLKNLFSQKMGKLPSPSPPLTNSSSVQMGKRPSPLPPSKNFFSLQMGNLPPPPPPPLPPPDPNWLKFNASRTQFALDSLPKKVNVREDQQSNKLEHLSDENLGDEILRMETTPKEVLVMLKDGGASLTASLERHREERKRRKLQHLKNVLDLGKRKCITEEDEKGVQSVPSHRKRHRVAASISLPSLKPSIRDTYNTGFALVSAIEKVDQLVKDYVKMNSKSDMADCVEALEELDLTDGLYYSACRLLLDERHVALFLALPANRQLGWLKAELGNLG